MSFVKRTRVKPTLPHMPARRIPRVPVRRVTSMTMLGDNAGTDGTGTILSGYAAKVNLCWRASCSHFFGRPAFRGTRARKVECSKSATNSSDPSGRPVWVYCRKVASSLGDSMAARYSIHPATVQRFRQGAISSRSSGAPLPQCAAALDHRHWTACGTMPARTGFNST